MHGNLLRSSAFVDTCAFVLVLQIVTIALTFTTARFLDCIHRHTVVPAMSLAFSRANGFGREGFRNWLTVATNKGLLRYGIVFRTIFF